MKTPQEWYEKFHLKQTYEESIEIVSAIQKEAWEAGYAAYEDGVSSSPKPPVATEKKQS